MGGVSVTLDTLVWRYIARGGRPNGSAWGFRAALPLPSLHPMQEERTRTRHHSTGFLVQVLPQSLLSPLLFSTPLLVAPRPCLRAPVSR